MARQLVSSASGAQRPSDTERAAAPTLTGFTSPTKQTTLRAAPARPSMQSTPGEPGPAPPTLASRRLQTLRLALGASLPSWWVAQALSLGLGALHHMRQPHRGGRGHLGGRQRQRQAAEGQGGGGREQAVRKGVAACGV